MAKVRTKSWIASEILTAADLNAEFDALLSSPIDLISPATAALDMDGQEIIMDADQDSSLTVDTDDVLHVKLKAIDAFIFDGDIASSANGMTFATSASTDPVSITAQGTGAAIGISLITKGTGEFKVTGDIESGTWTPDVAFGGASVGITYTTQTGSYRRIGNMVFVQINIVLTSIGSSTGVTTISLPIAAAATIPAGVFSIGDSYGITYSGNLTLFATPGSALAELWENTEAGAKTNLGHTSLAADSTIKLSGWYEV